jgi:hypothetical protein
LRQTSLGTSAEAQEAALRDADQYYIDSFLAYKGNPEVRNTIIFIKFVDGCTLDWSKDLYDTDNMNYTVHQNLNLLL